MKTKYTKGKWESGGFSKESNGYINIDFPNGSISIYGGLLPSIEPDAKLFIEEAEANAKLIASAPDLLEALQRFVKFVDSQELPYESSMILQAKQAIKKATT